MKTGTRAKILEIINKRSGVRPSELIQTLELTPQAVHRHLRTLLEEGRLERRGAGPKVLYFVAGKPQLERVQAWFGAKSKPAENPPELICETRDAFAGRLPRLTSTGLGKDEQSLAIAAVGEIGNNSFDHNLGHWKDTPGCWYQTQTTGGRLWICVADRGQGILKSLARVDPGITDDHTALVTAFEKILSGRAPERRGNGLKYVRNIITGKDRRGLACRSGNGLVDYGKLGVECREELARFPESAGTVTLILWSLK
ncbi:MAG: winged helix-turn-helix transcriptional regulator [Elusimicrobia bacterium]|nr:winged helix-turn-helix transcriptional regulator [Elusimicrobiota bacterium]